MVWRIANFSVYSNTLQGIQSQCYYHTMTSKDDDNLQQTSRPANNTQLEEKARSLGYDPSQMDLASPKEKASQIQKELLSAKSFGELDGKLAARDLWLDYSKKGLFFTDGFQRVNASSIDSSLTKKNLQQLYGEDLKKYIDIRNSGINYSKAGKKVQNLFIQETIKDFKSKREEIKSELSSVRYEMARIQTAPKETRNVSRKEDLIKQKDQLLGKHQQLTSEISKLEKKHRGFRGRKPFKTQANHVKMKAQRAGEKVKYAKEGFKIKKKSMKGMQSAREVIGFQKMFEKGIQSTSDHMPSKITDVKSLSKPVMSITYSAYRSFARIANDPEVTR